MDTKVQEKIPSFGLNELYAFVAATADATKSDNNLIQMLSGADATTVRALNHMCLRAALEHGRLPVAQHIISTFVYTREEVIADSNYGFRWACARGFLATAQWLESEYALTPTEARSLSNFAVKQAAAGGYTDIIQWLATTYLDGTDFRADGAAAFVNACINGCGPICMWISDTYNFTDTDLRAQSNAPIKWACANGNLEMAQHLVMKGLTEADIHADNDTPLQWAALAGRFQILQWLLDNYTFTSDAIHAAAVAARANSRADVAEFLEPTPTDGAEPATGTNDSTAPAQYSVFAVSDAAIEEKTVHNRGARVAIIFLKTSRIYSAPAATVDTKNALTNPKHATDEGKHELEAWKSKWVELPVQASVSLDGYEELITVAA